MIFIDNLKSNWKQYSTYLIIAIAFLLIGMTATEVDTLKQILINTVSGIILNAPWFILIFIGISILAKAIKESGKGIIRNVPLWIEDFYKRRMQLLRVERAIGSMR